MQRNKTKIVTVINQKGGAGKTTVSFHLAHAGLLNGQARVLCIDLDSQGNLSQFLSNDLDIIKQTKGGAGLLFEDRPIEALPTTHPQIDLLHGHKEMDRYDADPLAEDRAYAADMPEKLRSLGYDYIIIDTPPAVGLRHLSPLFWSDVALIPVEPSLSGISGMQNVVEEIDHHFHAINPALRWYAVMNRCSSSVRSHREKDQWVRSQYGNKVLTTLYTRSAIADAMEESPAQPVWLRKGANNKLREQWQGFCQKVIEK